MRSFFHTTRKAQEGGFTIVEVLVALTLFSIAVAGVITAAVQGGINISAAQNTMTSSYLAQEGIELMRAKRDSYVLSDSTSYDSGWNAFVSGATTACSSAGPCDVDVSDTTTPMPSGVVLGLGYVPCAATCVLKYDSNGYYSHAASGTPTKFSRRITVVGFTSGTATVPKEIQITVTVTWTQGLSTQSVSETESMFDWYTPSP